MDATLNLFHLDSFKLRIPYEKATIVNLSLLGPWLLVNDDTGEVDNKTYKKDSMALDENGIKVRYAIEHQMTGEQVCAKFLVILINSKTLKEKYFEGITESNIKLVYDYLMSQKVVSISYDNFLSGELTDVDFKRDTIETKIEEKIKTLLEVTSFSSLQIHKKNVNKKNKMIQWSDRGKADLSKPFWKVYHKTLELIHNSTKFFENYILDNCDNYDNRVRVEFTVKNKKHFRKYSIEDTSLKNILSLSQKTKVKMFEGTISKHLDIYEVKPMKITNKLNPNDYAILTFMGLISESAIVPIDVAIERAVNNIESRSQRSQKRKEYKTLWTEHLQLHYKEQEKRAVLKQEIREFLFG